jgi:hypothetical protein
MSDPPYEDEEDLIAAVETGELDPDEVEWLGVDEGADDET